MCAWPLISTYSSEMIHGRGGSRGSGTDPPLGVRSAAPVVEASGWRIAAGVEDEVAPLDGHGSFHPPPSGPSTILPSCLPLAGTRAAAFPSPFLFNPSLPFVVSLLLAIGNSGTSDAVAVSCACHRGHCTCRSIDSLRSPPGRRSNPERSTGQ